MVYTYFCNLDIQEQVKEKKNIPEDVNHIRPFISKYPITQSSFLFELFRNIF